MAKPRSQRHGPKAVPREVTQAFQLLQSGQVDAAESALRRTLRRKPKHLPTHIAYTYLLTVTGRPLQAIDKLDALLSTHPHHPDLHMARARAWQEVGDLDESQNDLLQVIEGPATPEEQRVDACYMIGRQLLESQELSEAIQWLESACALLTRDSHEHFLYLGIACMRAGSWIDAIAAFEQGLELDPASVDLHLGLAETFRLSADPYRARTEYEAALALAPNHPRAVAGLAQLALSEKNDEEADRILQAAIQASDPQPPHPDIATIYVRLCRRRKRPGDAIDILRTALRSKQLSPMQKAQLCSDLGSLLEQHEHDYDRAFDCFRKSNAALSVGPVDPRIETTRVDHIIKAFDSQRIQQFTRASDAEGSDRLVFIVGMPRSGTSLIEQIIASHPHAFGAGELDRLNNASIVLAQSDESALRHYPDYVADLTPDMLNKAAATYLNHVNGMLPPGSQGPIRIITDKMPHNYHYLGLIPMLLPGARVIHCRRHPLDTCLSCYATPLNPALTYTTNLQAIGQTYRQYHRLMQHWHDVADALSLPILDVQYEKLVNNLESGARELIDFCGLDWDERCLSFHETTRTVATASTEQVRTPLYTSSVGRYRHYLSQLARLADDLADLIDQSA
ncbi:MAG: sulfotransferase family protein [Planctomycetes bacterium]|nr:sulfotransferase family protein [Planctomycetota bacterium]NOG54622.1 hypothetical protein [Planctomycetota bacterium]